MKKPMTIVYFALHINAAGQPEITGAYNELETARLYAKKSGGAVPMIQTIEFEADLHFDWSAMETSR